MSAPLKSTEDVLRALARLTESDRRWILDKLSPASKARLASLSGQTGERREDPRPLEETSAIEASMQRLWTLRAAQIVPALQAEPGWVIHSVLYARSWPWRKAVLERLPALIRLEVNHLQRSGVTLALPAQQFLLRTLSERVREPSKPPNSFEALLARFDRAVGS